MVANVATYRGEQLVTDEDSGGSEGSEKFDDSSDDSGEGEVSARLDVEAVRRGSSRGGSRSMKGGVPQIARQ